MRRFRLQFLGGTTDRVAIVLDEREVRSPDVSAAVQEIADIVWPTHAIGLRLVDLEGHVVHEESRGDVGSRPRDW
jgi:hypothetical protein